MSIYGKSSDLGQFVMQVAYNDFYEAIKKYAAYYKRDLEFREDALKDGYFEIEDIVFKFAVNVAVVDNTVNFDAIIEAEFSARKKYRYDYDYVSEMLWFKLNCTMTVEDKLSSFTIRNTSAYSNEEKKKIQFAATANFVPVISREEFDAEAERFLQKWFPQALTEPMPVPIDKIAKSIGLIIIDSQKLSHNFSVFGQICFADGLVKVFDEEKRCYVNIETKRGTIFIDPDTFFLRNLGCANNTIAHEVFHWERHRIYATIRNALSGNQTIAYRCPTAPSGNTVRNALANDEDWMEWQANGIAPKILMPKVTAKMKINELVAKYSYRMGQGDCFQKLELIIDDLADFYQVSKQAAKIRLIELDYPEAAKVYNFEGNQFFSNEITPIDAFNEYINNEEFRLLIDLGLFCNAGGIYVINTDRYRTETENGYILTDYAKENFAQCTLNFSYNIVQVFEFNREHGVMYKGQRKARPVEDIFYPKYNQESIDKALAAVGRIQKQIDDAQKLADETAAQTITRYMAQANWNSSKFQTYTGVNSGYYRKLTTTPNKKIDLPILISICVGLRLPNEISRKLVEKAGYKLNSDNIEDITYGSILAGIVPQEIPACNALIEKIMEQNKGSKIRLLGSQYYDGVAE